MEETIDLKFLVEMKKWLNPFSYTRYMQKCKNEMIPWHAVRTERPAQSDM
jgi:hypothetical protein